ncbi:MAG: lytic transglycosylase domain-containing protein [Deltaproteobacteria bacterium]|nr:lytic transglycosylase domain-containing protein [Deltaproteobacteria bacterium]
MAVERPLSIRDYLEPRQAAAGSRLSGTVTNKSSLFQDVLKNEKGKDAQGQAAGLTISDYLKRRVSAKPTARTLSRAGSEGYVAAPANSVELKKVSAVARQGRVEKLKEAEAPQSSPRSTQAPRRVFGRLASDNAAGEEIERSIQKAAVRYNLSPDLIRGVIRAESNFQAQAVSSAGAQGLMQLMPETAGELGVTRPFDIQQNIDGGSRYLRQMLDRFGGNLKLALAAYNAGPGAVEKYEGRVPYAETQEYVKRVLRYSGEKA